MVGFVEIKNCKKKKKKQVMNTLKLINLENTKPKKILNHTFIKKILTKKNPNLQIMEHN